MRLRDDALQESPLTGKRLEPGSTVASRPDTSELANAIRFIAIDAIVRATQAAIAASVDTPGLLRISAGNYGGRLGKSFVYLHPEKQPNVASS